MQYILSHSAKGNEWKSHKYTSKDNKNGKWRYNYDKTSDAVNRSKNVGNDKKGTDRTDINVNRGTAAEALIKRERKSKDYSDYGLGTKVKQVRNEMAITNSKYNTQVPSERGRAKRSAEKELLGDAAENIRKRYATDNSIDSIARMQGIFSKIDEYRELGYSSEEIINNLLDKKDAATILSILNKKLEG